MNKEQWNEQRTEAWRKAWTDLINVCSADTLNGMYTMLNGGGNLLGAIVGGGPYRQDGEEMIEEPEDEKPHRLTITERAALMTELAQATQEGMSIHALRQLEEALDTCLSRDEELAQEFEGNELENAVYRCVVDELRDEDSDDAVTGDDMLEEFITLTDEIEVAELASDIEARLGESGLVMSVETSMIRSSVTVADLSKAIARQAG